jgi:hypothetical protein
MDQEMKDHHCQMATFMGRPNSICYTLIINAGPKNCGDSARETRFALKWKMLAAMMMMASRSANSAPLRGDVGVKVGG